MNFERSPFFIPREPKNVGSVRSASFVEWSRNPGRSAPPERRIILNYCAGPVLYLVQSKRVRNGGADLLEPPWFRFIDPFAGGCMCVASGVSGRDGPGYRRAPG